MANCFYDETIPDEIRKVLNRSVYTNEKNARKDSKCAYGRGCARNSDECFGCPYARNGRNMLPYAVAFPAGTESSKSSLEEEVSDGNDYSGDADRRLDLERMADMIERKIPGGKVIWYGIINHLTEKEIAVELGINVRNVRRKMERIRDHSGITPDDLKNF